MSDEEKARDARIREIVAQFADGDLAYLVARIAALEAENAELHFVRELAEEEIIADREYLNIAGQEIDALKAENARMRGLLREMTGATPVTNRADGQEWHAVSHELVMRAARLLLASASDTTNTP